MSGHERSSRPEGVSPAGELAGGDLEILGQMPNASNSTFLARCGGPDGPLAVYKPQRGETPLWDFPEGSLHRREVAAWVVADALGWPNVPQTVLRDGPFGLGSVQRFVRFDTAHHYFTLDRLDDFRRIALFDLIVNNADRKGGHCLLGEDDRVWVIDHGVCFHEEPKLRTVIWDFVGEPLPAELLADVGRLGADLGAGGPAAAALGGLLALQETAAMRERLASLLAAARFPEPEPDRRPYPWPPI